MSQPHDVTRRTLLIAGGIGAMAAAWPASAGAACASSEWTAVEKANVKVVTDFLAAWEAGDVERIVKFLTDDSLVRLTAHTQRPPLAGPAPVADAARKFFSTSSLKFKVLETMASGPIVVSNRIDRNTTKTGIVDYYYLGVFFLKDGKVKEWSDYEVAPSKPVKPGQPF